MGDVEINIKMSFVFEELFLRDFFSFFFFGKKPENYCAVYKLGLFEVLFMS